MRRREAMRFLSDDLLIETYKRARDLKLSHDFLMLIHQEMERRSIVDKQSFTP